MQKRREKARESYHVIHCTGVACRHAYMYSHATILHSVPTMETRQQPTESNIKHTKQNLVYIAKEKQLLDLQHLQQSRSSAVMLQTQFRSRGRTCLSAGTCLVLLASL